MRGALAIPGEKEHPYLWRLRDTERNRKEWALLTSPPLCLLPSAPALLFCPVFPQCSLFIRQNIKTFRFNPFFRSLIPCEASCVVENLTLNDFVCFSPVNVSSVHLIYGTPAREPREVVGKISLSTEASNMGYQKTTQVFSPLDVWEEMDLMKSCNTCANLWSLFDAQLYVKWDLALCFQQKLGLY